MHMQIQKKKTRKSYKMDALDKGTYFWKLCAILSLHVNFAHL